MFVCTVVNHSPAMSPEHWKTNIFECKSRYRSSYSHMQINWLQKYSLFHYLCSPWTMTVQNHANTATHTVTHINIGPGIINSCNKSLKLLAISVYGRVHVYMYLRT